MNKKEFMQKLKQLLPEKDKRDILLDYEEHFLSGLTDGKTEEEIVRELGSPEEVAKEFGYNGKIPVRYPIWAAVGLVTFDLFIGIPVLASLFLTWICLWAIPAALFIASIVLIVVSFLSSFLVVLPWYIMIPAGVSLLGLSLLFGIGMVYVTKAFYLAVKWYVMLHAKIFSGK